MLNLRLFVLLISLAIGPTDNRAQVEPITLTVGNTVEIPAPAFSFMGNAQCDSKGNLYFHAVTFVNDPAILKMERSGALKLYRLSQDDATSTYFAAFRVHPDGKLWLLDTDKTNDHRFVLFAFGADSDTPNRTRIDLPEGFDFKNFLVLANGHLLMHGSFGSTASPQLRNRSGFVEFDPSGRMLRQSLKSNSEGKDRTSEEHGSEDKNDSPRFPEAGVAYGDDGLIYTLQPNEVSVLSASGKELRRIRFEAPEPGFYPTNVGVAGNYLAVFFVKPNKDHLLMGRYEIFDVTTGSLLRVYANSEETGNNAVCFSQEGLTFFRVRNRRVVRVDAPVK